MNLYHYYIKDLIILLVYLRLLSFPSMTIYQYRSRITIHYNDCCVSEMTGHITTGPQVISRSSNVTGHHYWSSLYPHISNINVIYGHFHYPLRYIHIQFIYKQLLFVNKKYINHSQWLPPGCEHLLIANVCFWKSLILIFCFIQ